MRIIYAGRRAIRRFIFVVVLVCVALACAGAHYYGNRLTKSSILAKVRTDPVLIEASQGLSLYDIIIIFNPQKKELYCKQTIDYVNEHNVDFQELYFHLYPNGFKDEKRVPFLNDEKEKAYPNGFSPGWIEFGSVSIQGTPADFQIGGYSDDILAVLLEEPLKPRGSTKIEMEYTVKIPNSIGRFGYGEHTFNITNWYPIACVYDDEGWNRDPYYPIGDPFYSDTANYRVKIKAPANYTIATTGAILDINAETDYRLWDIEALAVRDFAWQASEEFEVESRQIDGIVIHSYFLPQDRNEGLNALNYAAWAIKTFNDRFGKYPYKQFSVVQSDFFIGGMEYPNLVMVDRNLYRQNSETWLEYVIVHETAHQWWYGLVGNDQIDEAWLDEALAEYSTILYYGHRYGEEKEKEIYNSVIVEGKCYYLDNYIDNNGVDYAIDQSIYDFPHWLIYDLLVYGKGASIFHEMRETVGDKKFYAILKEYYRSNRFKNATLTELLIACEKITGESWEEYFGKRLNGQ